MILAALAVITIAVIAPRFSDGPPEATVDTVACIVAGETAANCPPCDELIACTIARDIARGIPASRLHPGRWRGWSDWPTEAHRELAREVLANGGRCAGVPDCRFVGNVADYAYNWRDMGSGVIHCGTRGCVVCVPWAGRGPTVTEIGERRGAR